jgi:hypothetical protein
MRRGTVNDIIMSDIPQALPQALIDAVRARHIVPFVGAGVSMGVAEGLFPSWPVLLGQLVAEMTAQACPAPAIDRAVMQVPSVGAASCEPVPNSPSRLWL